MPVEKNKDYLVKIEGMTHEGQGVARINGFAVFIDGAILNEELMIKIIKVNKNFAIGKIIEIITPSFERQEPFCPTYKRCGGCSLQHMSYVATLEFKKQVVNDAINRIGGIDIQVNNTIGMNNPFEFRNKSILPVGIKNDNYVCGFYAKRSHEIIDIVKCSIHDKTTELIRKLVLDFLQKNSISIYDETNGKGLVRHLIVRNGLHTNEFMVILVINGNKLPKAELLVEYLTKHVNSIRSIVLNINTEKTNIVMGNKNILLYGTPRITDIINNIKFEISPLSFFQVNTFQTEILYNKVLDFAGLTGNETVVDLYCGIGSITLNLAKRAKFVYGVEVVSDAVKDAEKNAKTNNLSNVEFIEGEADKAFSILLQRGIKPEVVVVDPPRKGCEPELLQTIIDVSPEKFIYVSCNPSTLARDIKIMREGRYNVVEVQPVDMFPWSSHVECVVLMSRVDK